MSEDAESVDDTAAPAPGEAAARLGTALAREAARQLATPLAGGLYLVATPIGNLGDMTVRALAVLSAADVVYCEDTRHSRTLLAHYGIGRPLGAYHDHNGERERPRILAALAAGRSVALLSDAGTPLIADPGFKLVREAVAAGHRIVPVPGASALLAGLTLAGLATDTVLFAGFMPPKKSARRRRILELAPVPATLILFETAPRLAESLADLAAGLGNRAAVVVRELTKRHEAARRGTLAELAEAFAAEPARGEVVIVVGPSEAAAARLDDSAIVAQLAPLLITQPLREAVRIVAEALGTPRNRVYGLALGLKREQDQNQ